MGATVFYASAEEKATLSNVFEVDGTPTDPTAVTLVVTDPSGTPATSQWPTPADLTRASAGSFSLDVACSAAGTWQYVWTGTGTASDVVSGTWLVHPTEQQSLYCTPAMLKSRQGITDVYDDDQILDACTATARWIDEDYCERFFYRHTATLAVRAGDRYVLCLPPEAPDLVSVTALRTDDDGDGAFETTWSASDYQLLPVNAQALLLRKPYTQIRALGRTWPIACPPGRLERVQIEGVWGWPAVPPPVREAAKILASDYLKLGGMAFGVAGYGDYGAVRAKLSSPAMSMLNPFRLNLIKMG